MRIAVVGAGVSGLVAARLLQPISEITVFEAEGRLGGHARTVEVDEEGRSLPMDTGFLVYNERNYPLFTRLLDRLGVVTRPSDMSFSLRDETAGLEYRGSSLDTLFAQRRNLLRPSFYRMLRDVLRFNREAEALVASGAPTTTLGELLDRGGYSRAFRQQHLLPMGGAIWSMRPRDVEGFPAQAFVNFFRNHGLLSLRDRPQWRTVVGGSRRYVEALTRPYLDRVRLQTPVAAVRRDRDGVELATATGESHRFDHVVLGCHSDQALRMLVDADEAEREVLGAIQFQSNPAQLHTDIRVLPRRRKAWASWNVRVGDGAEGGVGVSYHLNRLQALDSRRDFLLSLNQASAIDPASVVEEHEFEHPRFDAPAIVAQGRLEEIQGRRNTWFCGAYWGHGFHEDGVRSGVAVARRFGRDLA